MQLTRNQFDVLFAMSKSDAALTQRELVEATGLALGTVNSVIKDLAQAGCVEQQRVTAAGLAALAPYRVDNAVIMAAGMSSRFAPISYEKPKGLLLVRGEVLIERQIEQLIAAGITDITVIVGYRQEYYFYLRGKYGVQIAINEEYATRNNTGSLWVVREQLGNTFVCSSDDYFTENPFASHVFEAYYASEYVAGETDEWCLKTTTGGRITGATVGGRDAWVMLGHVFFDRAFSTEFARILERVYDHPDTIDRHWEAVFLDHVKDLTMVKREYPEGYIYEFDSLDELRGFDPLFIENVDSEVLDNIVDALDCERTDITRVYPLKQGITNLSCHFEVDGKRYVYRHPGVGTEKLIDREAEFAALDLAKRLKIDKTFLHGDAAEGWKISKYVKKSRSLDVTNAKELKRAMKMLRKLHGSGEVLDLEFDFIDAGLNYERVLLEHGEIEVPGYHELRDKVFRLKELADREDFPKVPSHNDFFHLNFLVNKKGKLNLIDWEYAGMSDIANDFATLAVCSEFTREEGDQALEYYFGRPATTEERRHFWAYVVFAGWCWYIWALAKEAEGDNVGEWLFIYYRHAADYVDEVIAAYERDLALAMA